MRLRLLAACSKSGRGQAAKRGLGIYNGPVGAVRVSGKALTASGSTRKGRGRPLSIIRGAAD